MASFVLIELWVHCLSLDEKGALKYSFIYPSWVSYTPFLAHESVVPYDLMVGYKLTRLGSRVVFRNLHVCM